MKRQRLALTAAGLILAVTVPAHADPISATIAAIASWATASAISAGVIGTSLLAAEITFDIVTAALYATLSIGLSYAAAAIRGTPKLPEGAAAPVGSSGKLSASGITPRSMMVGYGMTAGKLVYANTWGASGKTPNAYLTLVIALSDLPCDSLEGLIVNDSPATYGDGSPDANLGYSIPEFEKGGSSYLWVKFYDGTQTAVDSHLNSVFGADPSFPYEDTRVGTGIAYVIVTALVEPTLFSGFPTFKFILNGAKFYDPRLDDTAGGDGDQRHDDSDTWEWTQNPKVIQYNILRGITYGSRWFYGLQSLTANRLPTSSWFAAMNECDLEVDNEAASTEPQYRCGGEIAVNVQPADAIEELDKCCNGRLAEIGGIYKTHVGAAGTPILTFSDSDLLSTEAQTFDQFPSLAELINAVTASFPDPDQGWEMSPAPGRYSSAYELADGGRQLVSDVQYSMVPFPEQVQRLQTSALAEARRFRKHTIPLPPSCWSLEPLDFVSWTSTRNGYSTKTFRVDLATDQGNLDMVLVITETDPSDYDWTPSSDFIPAVSGALVIQRPAAQPMSGWAVSGETVDGDGGRAKPAIRISWGTTDITDVDGVQYQIRLTSSGDIVLAGETDHFGDGTILVSQNLSSDTDYQARGKYRPTFRNRDTDWSSWLDVTTPDVRIGASDIEDAILTFGKFAAGITPVQQVNSLASAITGEGYTAVLSTDGQLYRYHSGAWTLAVPAVNVTGTLSDSQLAAIAAAKVTGTLSDSQLAAISASKVTGTLSDSQLAAISAAKITGTISGSQIAAATITSGNIASGTIVAGNIAASTITGTQIAARTIDAGNIVSGTITAGEIAASTITGTQIAAHTIAAGNIVSGTITAGEIAAGTITATQISAGTITATELAANSVTAAKVAANAITAGTIAVGAINVGTEIVDNLIVTGHLVSNSVTNLVAASNASGDASFSYTVSSAAGPVLLVGAIGPNGGVYEVQRDGSTLQAFAGVIGADGPIVYVDNPGAGTYTYSTFCSSGTFHATLSATEMKR